jgi:predicted ester cyclase
MTAPVAIKENKQLLKTLHESGYPGGPDAAQKFFAPDYVAHGLWSDLEGLKSSLRSFLDTHPNAEWVVEDMVGELDKIAVRCEIRVRAAGAVRRIGSIMVYRIANNKIVEQWGHGDPPF